MVTAAVKARLKALRKRFHLGEYSKKHKRHNHVSTAAAVSHSRRKGGSHMARRSRKSGRSRGMFGGGWKSLAKGLLVGVALTALTGRKEIGALGGFVLGGPIGAAGGYFANEIGGAVNKATGTVTSGTSSQQF